MRAGDLIGRTVVDAHGRRVGVCTDLRCDVVPRPADEAPELVLVGLLVSPRHAGSLLGYERDRTRGPWLVRVIVGRMHRGMTVVEWDDVAEIGRDIVLREGAGEVL